MEKQATLTSDFFIRWSNIRSILIDCNPVWIAIACHDQSIQLQVSLSSSPFLLCPSSSTCRSHLSLHPHLPSPSSPPPDAHSHPFRLLLCVSLNLQLQVTCTGLSPSPSHTLYPIASVILNASFDTHSTRTWIANGSGWMCLFLCTVCSPSPLLLRPVSHGSSMRGKSVRSRNLNRPKRVKRLAFSIHFAKMK